MFCEQIGYNPRKEGIFKVNAVNRDNLGGEALQEDYRRQTLQNFHNKLLFKTGRRQHTFGILMIVNHRGYKMEQSRSSRKNLDIWGGSFEIGAVNLKLQSFEEV